MWPGLQHAAKMPAHARLGKEPGGRVHHRPSSPKPLFWCTICSLGFSLANTARAARYSTQLPQNTLQSVAREMVCIHLCPRRIAALQIESQHGNLLLVERTNLPGMIAGVPEQEACQCHLSRHTHHSRLPFALKSVTANALATMATGKGDKAPAKVRILLFKAVDPLPGASAFVSLPTHLCTVIYCRKRPRRWQRSVARALARSRPAR